MSDIKGYINSRGTLRISGDIMEEKFTKCGSVVLSVKGVRVKVTYIAGPRKDVAKPHTLKVEPSVKLKGRHAHPWYVGRNW